MTRSNDILKATLRTAVTTLLVVGTLFGADARRRTNNPKPQGQIRAEAKADITPPTPPAIAVEAGQITLSGYDKPLRSRVETLLVTNNTAADATELHLVITYRDTRGRQLHQRDLWVVGPFPAGETRQATFKSWDPQQSYVYIHSAKPRARHTPYDITITPDSIR